jgi:glutamate/tyrosine decarboxylase-like PLP-dependent enzyme
VAGAALAAPPPEFAIVTRKTLPLTGRSTQDVLAELRHFGDADPDYHHARLWSLVYYLDEGHADFLAEAQRAFASANGLNPTAFKSLKRFETEVIDATTELLHGGDEACGVLTSGGTESCLLAVKTYRDLARAKRRVKRPEMIVPRSAHVAWFKAAEYFGVKLRLLPLDAGFRADLRGIDKLINRNTVMLLGSAPAYPHGVIDPIEAMCEVAARHGVPLHVDACVGGFILPFMALNGVELPRWDYAVPGVMSISADVHKYGFAAKGASTITYRNLELLKHQMFVCQDWPGGVFASPALLGTRPGGAYAAAWAALQHFGVAGYRELAARAIEAFERIRRGIEALPELHVLGDPKGPLLAYGSRDRQVNIYAVGDQMDARGWKINRLQFPEGLHAMVTAQHLEVVDAYLSDLKDSVAVVKADPSLGSQGEAATYGLMAHIPLRGMVRQRVLDIFANLYRAGGAELDLSAQGGLEGDYSHAHGAGSALLDRLALRYVAWRQRCSR